MRWIVPVAIVASSGIAAADKRLDDIAAGYAKESAACQRSERGVAEVLAGAKTLPDEAADTEKLDKGHAIVASYCAELDAAQELIKGATSYKSIEGKLDESDNKIRRLRAASKKAVADLEPTMHRLIPKINAARVGPQVVTDHRTPAKFPSGRAVELPQLPGGEWKLSGTAATDIAEYADKNLSVTITAQPFHEATCEQERRRLTGTVVDLEVPAPAKQAGVIWVSTYKQTHYFHVTCAQGSSGGVVATIEANPGDPPKIVDELAKLSLRMIQAQLAPR